LPLVERLSEENFYGDDQHRGHHNVRFFDDLEANAVDETDGKFSPRAASNPGKGRSWKSKSTENIARRKDGTASDVFAEMRPKYKRQVSILLTLV
jgi:hypothetical protein